VQGMLWREFFPRKPPKTAGREEFGREFVREFLRSCGRCRKQDVVATATALTAKSIADAVKRFVLHPSSARKPGFREIGTSRTSISSETPLSFRLANRSDGLVPSYPTVKSVFMCLHSCGASTMFVKD